MTIFRREKGIPEPEEEKKEETKPVIDVVVSEEGVKDAVEATAETSEPAKDATESAVETDGAGTVNVEMQPEEATAEESAETAEETSAETPAETPKEDTRPVGRFSNGKID